MRGKLITNDGSCVEVRESSSFANDKFALRWRGRSHSHAKSGNLFWRGNVSINSSMLDKQLAQ